MNQHFKDIVLRATQASDLQQIEVVQSLWSGYGSIVRYALTGGDCDRVIIKHVKLPKPKWHPLGRNTDLSHQRKLRSYEIESHWYADWSKRCDADCRVPHCLALEAKDDEVLMVLEDLDASGFGQRRHTVSWDEIVVCLHWLGNFHATFMNVQPDGLWPSGTYWHLDTRPDELKALSDSALRAAAPMLDEHLKRSPYQTIVHGDAKLANFCFSPDGTQVAAVDFQYVGGGCGMKDLAYFTGSCLCEEDCEELEGEILTTYFGFLRAALCKREPALDRDALECNWRELYRVAWTDFHRFLKGWSPGRWRKNSYSERVSRQVVERLKVQFDV